MKQIEKFMNAMVIDYAHAATGNRVKWAFTSDTRADVVEMAVAVYRRNARRPYMIIFPQYNAIRNEINTVAAVILEGDDARNIMEGIENVNAFKVTGSPYDNDGMSIYAHAAEQEQEAHAETETETEQATEEATPATEAAEEPATTAHPVPAKLAREYDARTYTNRDKWQRCRLPEWGGLCNSISWRYYHGAGTPRT